MGRASAKHTPQAPRVGAHDVILTGLDEEGDSTDDEMPPLEPLGGAAQLGVVWLRGHGKDRTSLPLVMPALVIGKGRENHCVQLPREEVHPRAMTGENTTPVGKSPCLR